MTGRVDVRSGRGPAPGRPDGALKADQLVGPIAEWLRSRGATSTERNRLAPGLDHLAVGVGELELAADEIRPVRVRSYPGFHVRAVPAPPHKTRCAGVSGMPKRAAQHQMGKQVEFTTRSERRTGNLDADALLRALRRVAPDWYEHMSYLTLV